MSTGTHRRRCREETCKEKNILIMAAVSQLSTVSGSVMSPTQVHSHCFEVFTLPVKWFVFCFSAPPPYLKHALQSVPRLYTGNGQVTNTESSSFRLSGSWRRLFHFPFWHLLSSHTMHDTLAFGISLQKQDVENFYKFSLTDVMWKSIDGWA